MNQFSLARGLERAWYGKSWLTLLLLPASWLFAGIVALRRMAYREGWLKTYRLDCPVIIVGNITVGGTGKTPVVAWLVERLAARGFSPGIVSRGYGGSAGRGPVSVAASDDARFVGDEALLLARRTGRPVCIGSDRVAAARQLVAEGVDVIVADDGLQHYRLGRDLEFVVLDADRGLGNRRLLPAGPLREPGNRLASADLLLVNGNPGPADGYGFELIPGELVNLGSKLRRPLADWQGQRVWSVAGIGNPDRFHRLLRDAGLLVEAPGVADHGRLGLEALRAQAPWPILMTEKDAVKYPQAPADCWYLPVSPSFAPGALAAVDALLDGLRPASGQ